MNYPILLIYLHFSTIDFHDVEREILKDKGCAKLVLKILKHFRDCNQPIKNLFSYALKTIVMEMIRDDPHDEWDEKQLAHHFLKTLKILNKKLENGQIEYFFDPNYNLLDNKNNLNPESIRSMAIWLRNVIQKLENSMTKPSCRKVWMWHFETSTMRIFIKTLTDQNVSLMVKPSDDIKTIKNM